MNQNERGHEISNYVVYATSKGSDQPAQSDQNLCYSLEYSMSVKLLTEQHLEFLSLKGGCTGCSESIYVKMSHCWKSHVAAQIILASFGHLFHASVAIIVGCFKNNLIASRIATNQQSLGHFESNIVTIKKILKPIALIMAKTPLSRPF